MRRLSGEPEEGRGKGSGIKRGEEKEASRGERRRRGERKKV
jgi:hypothetical protein